MTDTKPLSHSRAAPSSDSPPRPFWNLVPPSAVEWPQVPHLLADAERNGLGGLRRDQCLLQVVPTQPFLLRCYMGENNPGVVPEQLPSNSFSQPSLDPVCRKSPKDRLHSTNCMSVLFVAMGHTWSYHIMFPTTSTPPG